MQKINGLQRGDYLLKLVSNSEELALVQRLRFEVFNLELQEGLASSFEHQLDTDPFDSICSHLIVHHLPSHSIVGTYRMQTGRVALNNLGYYSAREFNLGPLDGIRSVILELGRACIALGHRNYFVLSLLWQGIAQYASENQARYLMGCSSITSQDLQVAGAAYHSLKNHLAPEIFRIQPNPGFECLPDHHPNNSQIKIPKLLSAYLSLGAWICGPPAIDREFKTIDFLTMLDLDGEQQKNKLKRFFE